MLKVLLILSLAATLIPGAPALRADPHVPDAVSRCLNFWASDDDPQVVCTAAIEAKGVSSDLLAMVYETRGVAACRAGDQKRGFEDLSKAIQLVPVFPHAFSERSYCNPNDSWTQILADSSEAIRLAPQSPEFYRFRGRLQNWQGHQELALADFDRAIQLDPTNNIFLDDRGVTLFLLGRYAEAAVVFMKVMRLTPGDPYPVLWLHLARLRAHQPDTDEFQAGVRSLSATQWPKPIFDAFQGRRSFRELETASPSAGGDDWKLWACESYFFSAENSLAKGDTGEETLSLLRAAVSFCDPSFNSMLAAKMELGRLGAPEPGALNRPR